MRHRGQVVATHPVLGEIGTSSVILPEHGPNVRARNARCATFASGDPDLRSCSSTTSCDEAARDRAARPPRPARRRSAARGGPAPAGAGRTCERWPTSMSKAHHRGYRVQFFRYCAATRVTKALSAPPVRTRRRSADRRGCSIDLDADRLPADRPAGGDAVLPAHQPALRARADDPDQQGGRLPESGSACGRQLLLEVVDLPHQAVVLTPQAFVAALQAFVLVSRRPVLSPSPRVRSRHRVSPPSVASVPDRHSQRARRAHT